MPDKVVSRENLKAFREKLDDKYVIEGEYSPSTSVGLSDEADALTPYGPNSGASDQSAFRFQTTGGSSDVGALAYQKKLLGNSVAFNQLFPIPASSKSLSESGITITDNRDGSYSVSGTATATVNLYFSSIPLTANHKYLLKGCPSGGSGSTYELACGPYLYERGNGIITTISTSATPNPRITIVNGTAISGTIKFIPQLVDLTQLSKEYSTVLAFNRDYPLPYYSHNAGQLFSCKTNKVRNVGYNAFDGVLEGGGISGNGADSTNVNNFRSKNYIKVIAGQTYTLSYNRNDLSGTQYIYEYDENKNFLSSSTISDIGHSSETYDYTLSSETHYIRFQFYKSGSNWKDNTPTQAQAQCCFHLTWDGSRTGYEPYQVNEYAMPNIELKGGFDSDGNHWGDELLPDGTLITGAGVVDLGSLEWTQASNGYFTAVINDMKLGAINSTLNHARCSKYIVYSNLNRGDYTDKGINYGYEGGGVSIRAKDTSISTDNATTFKNGLSGVYLVYELATPTTEQNDAYKYQEVQQVDDFGTQEALSSVTESASTPIVPQGFDFFYPVDYKAFIDSLGGRDDIEYDASQVASKTDLNFKELSSSYIGAITSSEVVAGEFYKNNIAITGGLSNAKYVIAVMSNGNKYPMIITSSLLVTYSGTSWQASNLTVTKIYYKE